MLICTSKGLKRVRENWAPDELNIADVVELAPQVTHGQDSLIALAPTKHSRQSCSSLKACKYHPDATSSKPNAIHDEGNHPGRALNILYLFHQTTPKIRRTVPTDRPVALLIAP